MDLKEVKRDEQDIQSLLKLWGSLDFISLCNKLKLNIAEIAIYAYNSNLKNEETPNIRRYWTKYEDMFLSNYAHLLTTKQASNLLYRSRKAVYERAGYLGLSDIMVRKKKY